VAELVGEQLAGSISKAAVSLYAKASQHAQSRGIILADTKFEFGLLNKTQLILVDEVLTPDSSRFWDAASYAAGRSQASFDKQYVRDWLKSKGLDKAADEGVLVTLPDDVVQRTAEKYQEAYERITGKKWLS
jgi:phosphoribosylaminoimidazole-succinocarboxamide synthase